MPRKDWAPSPDGNLAREYAGSAIVGIVDLAGQIGATRMVTRTERNELPDYRAVLRTRYDSLVTPFDGNDVDDLADKVAEIIKERVG